MVTEEGPDTATGTGASAVSALIMIMLYPVVEAEVMTVAHATIEVEIVVAAQTLSTAKVVCANIADQKPTVVSPLHHRNQNQSSFTTTFILATTIATRLSPNSSNKQ